MIKLTNIKNLFENARTWEKLKYNTIFKNEKELREYQKIFLNLLINSEICLDCIKIRTSGTTSNVPKVNKFPNKNFNLINNHHMWKIMHLNNIKEGNVLGIFQRGYDAPNKIRLSQKRSENGIKNNYWELIFNPLTTNKEFWDQKLKEIRKIDPVYIYSSPSTFISFHGYLKEKFNCPLISTLELLTNDVREKSNQFFTKTIDKMKDWSTGFGFFECPYGTKHVYDEFCLVKNNKENEIFCLNLFNYCYKPEFKKSDDTGSISQKKCSCGIYGNYLSNFNGKYFQNLISKDNKKLNSEVVNGSLSNLYKFKNIDLGLYQIIQRENKEIEFYTEKPLDKKDSISVAEVFAHLTNLNFNIIFNNINIGKIILNDKDNSFSSIKFFQGIDGKNKTITLRSFCN